MHRPILALLCLAAAGGCLAEAPTGAFMALGNGGQFAAGSFPKTDDWLGLECDGNGCSLNQVYPAIGRGAMRNILDEDEPTDVVHVHGPVIAVFSGLPALRNPVATWGRDPVLASPYAGGEAQGRFDLPLGEKGLHWEWQRSEDGHQFQHRLTDGERSQVLFELPAEGHYGGDTSTPALNWIGDIDGDGRLDLLLSLPDDSCSFDQRLYLSSLAAPGEWLGLAARFAGDHPACGC
ncbi:hypothetical protein [Pseudomarimonas salicorniae]|uniref:Repeat domain-containing protein n=1 Tax=Pseudomarimonas salicorniae TaxID=2933270 RepID=A0ABT0GMX1_9GAMM|nr:hypothetical protein [Lysobacter sp. CAU 1642]MCK7595347.1 hypothetical protein [Lysobacter sp. CAU 1642]